MESRSQSPEFRNDPENFHPFTVYITKTHVFIADFGP